MREFKFRAWHTTTGRMYKPATLEQLAVQSESHIADGWDKLVVMQYTGLKDKKGKEIYEGDIVAAKLNGGYIERVYWKGPPDIIGEVYHDLLGFRLKAKGEKDNRYASFSDICEEEMWEPLLMMSKSHSEVIGNIYENKDLL